MTEIRLIGSLQLTIQVVQYCHAGEQETHWDKTTKDQRASFICLVPVHPLALQ